MDHTWKFIIGIIIIISVLLVVGNIWFSMQVNNMERINITNSCSIKVPKDMEFSETGGAGDKGVFIDLNNWKGGFFGKLWIEYEQPYNDKIQGENSTEPFSVDRNDDIPGNLSCMIVVDKATNQKIVIQGESPNFVKKVAESVIFTNNTNNFTNNSANYLYNATNQKFNTSQYLDYMN